MPRRSDIQYGVCCNVTNLLVSLTHDVLWPFNGASGLRTVIIIIIRGAPDSDFSTRTFHYLILMN